MRILPVRVELLHCLKVEDALVLSYFLHKSEFRTEVPAHGSRIHNRTGMKPRNITSSINRLESLGLLSQFTKGHPPRRYVTLLASKVEAILSGEPVNYPTRKKKREHCESCAPVNWTQLGMKLANAIPRQTNSTSTPRLWGEHLRRLHTTDGVSPERISQTLDDYCRLLEEEGDLITNGNPNFIPIAYSGRAFREKFLRVEGQTTKKRRANGPQIKVKLGRARRAD